MAVQQCFTKISGGELVVPRPKSVSQPGRCILQHPEPALHRQWVHCLNAGASNFWEKARQEGLSSFQDTVDAQNTVSHHLKTLE